MPDQDATFPLPALRASGRGRPSEYDPAYCERVIEFGRMGKSRTWIAAELGVSRETLANWEKAHPDFLGAMARAKELSQQWWEDAGQHGLAFPGFNAGLWSKNMNCRFRDEWNEKIEIAGDQNAPIKTISEVTVKFIRPADKREDD